MRQQGSMQCGWLACVVVLLVITGMVRVSQAQFSPPEVTKQHEVLKQDVGVWDAEMKLWMAPGQEPMTSKGVERNRMMGGLWLISSFTVDLGGETFQGRGQFGYDSKKGKYIGTSISAPGSTP